MKKVIFSFMLTSVFCLYSCQDSITSDPITEETLLVEISEQQSADALPEKPLFSQRTTTEEEPEICGETYSTDILIVNEQSDAGQLTVSNDEENLYITYSVENDWRFFWVKLYVGDEEAIPVNYYGNPQVGSFNYDPFDAVSAYNTEVKFVIPLSDVGENPAIAAYALMIKPIGYYTYLLRNAWAFGENEFPGHRLDWYTNYQTQACEEPFPSIPECDNATVINSPVFNEVIIESDFEGEVPYTIFDRDGNELTSGRTFFSSRSGGGSFFTDVALPYVGEYFVYLDFNGETCFASFFADQSADG